MIPLRARLAALTGLVAGLLTGIVAAIPADATPPSATAASSGSVSRPVARPTAPVDGQPRRLHARPPFRIVKNRGEAEGTFSPTDPNTVFFTRFSPRPFAGDLVRGDLATGAVATGAVATGAVARSSAPRPPTRPRGLAGRHPAGLLPGATPDAIDLSKPRPPEQIHVAALDGRGTVASRR